MKFEYSFEITPSHSYIFPPFTIRNIIMRHNDFMLGHWKPIWLSPRKSVARTLFFDAIRSLFLLILERRDHRLLKSVFQERSRRSSFTRVWMWILILRHLRGLFGGRRINLLCTMRCKFSIRLRSLNWIRLIKLDFGIKCG